MKDAVKSFFGWPFMTLALYLRFIAGRRVLDVTWSTLSIMMSVGREGIVYVIKGTNSSVV